VAQKTPAANQPAAAGNAWGDLAHDILLGTGRRQGLLEAMGKSMVRSASSQVGRQLIRGVLGSLLR
jgi:hypothetical protein